MNKVWGAPSWVRNRGFCNLLKVASLVFLDIPQDCSLPQGLTSSRAEIVKKKVAQTWCLFIFVLMSCCSILFYNIVSGLNLDTDKEFLHETNIS